MASATLERLLRHDACANTRLGARGFERRAAHDDDNDWQPVRGLTALLEPVAAAVVGNGGDAHDAATCARCAPRAHRERGTGLCTPGRASRKYARDLVGTPQALARFAATLPRCGGGGAGDCEHGSHVDAQVCAALLPGVVAAAAAASPLDPCAVTALAYIARRQWRPLAVQLPLYSRTLRFATALDVLLWHDDGGLVLLELKATRHAESHRCYTATAAYARHQTQLWAMAHVLERDVGVRVREALVLRVSPARADAYPLHTAFFAPRYAQLVALFTAPPPPPPA